jgi:hypothetical protein
MTPNQHPILTPDPREAKLPSWARARLDAPRTHVRDQDKTVQSVTGEHEGSNVVLVGKPQRPDVPLPKNSSVAFKSNWGRIQVFHDLKGRVHIQGDSMIRIRPGGGNNITVELEKT